MTEMGLVDIVYQIVFLPVVKSALGFFRRVQTNVLAARHHMID